MKQFLSIAWKGLLVALLVVTLGGFLYVNTTKTDEINLQLISSSLVNQVKVGNYIQVEKTNEEENNKEENKDNEVKEVKDEEKEEKLIADGDKEVVNLDEKETPKETSDTTNKETETKTEQKTETNTKPKTSYKPNLEVANTMNVLKTYNGSITAYGPDCDGCGGLVAHGENVSNGNIYYQDKTFGSIRIVAGDASLKFGTIVRIKGLKDTKDPVIAIVLDRGGNISFSKVYFDLLEESEDAAGNFGTQKAVFQILRYGF